MMPHQPPTDVHHLGGPPSLLARIVSVPLWGAGIAWLVAGMAGIMALQSVVGADRLEWLNRLYCRGQILLTGSSWRAVVHPEVRADRPYLFLQNHINNLDHVTLYRATPHFKQGLELAAHFRYPVYGWFMRQRGTIPVHRGNGAVIEQLTEEVRAEVERGHSVLGFPEGTRTLDGRVGPFRSGLFVVAKRLGLPIVPVAVIGMQEVMRKGSWVIRPGRRVTVYCERPIATAGRDGQSVEALMAEVRRPIVERVDAYWRARGRLDGGRDTGAT